jgi:signal transduction histidine kinase
MPQDSGLAFLVVQHLDPTHRSEIAGLLGRHTSMPVTMAEDGEPIRPNHVYTIPPNRYLAVEDGKLSLTVPANVRSPKFSIDSLFDSLGRAFGEKAAGVVLTGTGTDGTQGLRAIKGHGGLAVVQDPATAEFDAMPRSAIEAGVVDTVATIEQVPEALITYFSGTIGQQQLEYELRIARDEHRRAVEQLQALNEELQSTNEELETSKEELQSLSEELGTVNTELGVTAQVEADRLRRDVLLRMVDIEERERHRLALEIHDETGQQVTAFLLGLEALRNICGVDERALEIIQHLETRARELAKDLVGVTLQLRPTALDAQGLAGALRDFADSILRDSSMEVDFVATGWEQGRLAGQTESALYRVAQEAIVNVLKHAHARRLSIVVERGAEAVTLIIEDDGKGFDSEAIPHPPIGHAGLSGMRERLHLIGGSLTIESSPGQGTTVLARVPFSTMPVDP